MWLLTTVNHHPLALSLMNGVFLGVREYDLPTQKISLMTLLATNMPASAIFDDDFLQLPQVKTNSFVYPGKVHLFTNDLFSHSFGFPARRWIQSIPPKDPGFGRMHGASGENEGNMNSTPIIVMPNHKSGWFVGVQRFMNLYLPVN